MLLKRSHRYLKCCVFQTTAAKFAKSTLSRTTLTIFFMLVHITTPYYSLITVCRKLFLKLYFYRPQRSCEGYVFTPVCLSTGGDLPQCMLGYHPPPPRSSHPPSRHPPGAGTPEQAPPPPSRRLLLRTVRILLECILVIFIFRHICGRKQ